MSCRLKPKLQLYVFVWFLGANLKGRFGNSAVGWAVRFFLLHGRVGFQATFPNEIAGLIMIQGHIAFPMIQS